MFLELTELLQSNNYEKIRELFAMMNVVDIALELGAMDARTAAKLFRILPNSTAAEIFAYLPPDIRQIIVEVIDDSEIGSILDELFIDDAVDFIEEMPASVVKRILENVSDHKRELINQYLKYPEGSVGSVMTAEYVSLHPDITVSGAFGRVRSMGSDRETIYTLYVTDDERRLIGVVSAKDLLLAEPNMPVSGLMKTNFIFANANDDREALANIFARYDLLAMPVVGNENRLIGIVTVDDVLEVQREETTEDFALMAAMTPPEKPYLKTSVFTLAKNRVIWLLLLMLSATLTGAIISGFEEALVIAPALVASIPMLMDTGGNAGSQSSTLVIRGMALEEIRLRDAGHVLSKEFQVALICGAALVAVNFSRLALTGAGIYMALTVSLALYATLILAKITGGLLPMLAKALRLDPAVMATPVITTLVDTCSLTIYFLLAKLILRV